MPDIVTTREIASLFWLATLTIVLLRQDKGGALKAAFSEVIRASLTYHILVPLLLAAVWIVGLVLVLAKYGWWETECLKSTLYWAVSVAAVSLIASREERRCFSGTSMVKRHLTAIVVLQVFVGIRPFPLAAELVLVPLSCLLGLAVTISGPDQASAKRGAKAGLVLLGLLLIARSVRELCRSPDVFLSDLASNAVLPAALTVGFLPCLICFYLTLEYRYAFRTIWLLKKSERFERLRATLRVVRCGAIDLERVALIETQMRRLQPTSVADVDEIVDEIEYTLRIRSAAAQDAPMGIDAKDWEVVSSLRCLGEHGLSPKLYRNVGQVWLAEDSTQSATRGPEIAITYCVVGARSRVTRLELTYEAHGAAPVGCLYAKFCDAVCTLVGWAVSERLARSMRPLIEARHPFCEVWNDYSIDFSCKEGVGVLGRTDATIVIKDLKDDR